MKLSALRTSYLQGRVDSDRRPDLFVLTRSQQFGLLSGVTQSLAGRVALVPLLPFSLTELQAADRAPGSLEELLKWKSLAGEAAGPAWLVYGGDERQSRSVAEVVSWRAIRDLTAGRSGAEAAHKA